MPSQKRLDRLLARHKKLLIEVQKVELDLSLYAKKCTTCSCELLPGMLCRCCGTRMPALQAKATESS